MKNLNIISSALLLSGTAAAQYSQQQPFTGKIGKTYEESTEAWTKNPAAPDGAPNVIWILIDDVGFGAASVFGGLINTPNLENLANQGLRYTNFHTCAISAPTRAALLTGRNSHAVHMGGFGHVAMSAGFPGWDGRIPSETGTVAEILRENGYNTFAVGKWGLVPDADVTDAGPFDRWPSGKGFDHFFGFLSSAADQYKPNIVEDNAHVEPDGRHLSAQITDKAIGFITRQKKVAPNKPFFLYYAPGATHAPHQVAQEWSDKYKGKFDEGWDVYREKVIERQKKLGLIPADAQLPARESRLEAWKNLSSEQKKLYARFFEVYAGYLEYTDYEIGRLVDYLKESGQLDNTAIFVIIGDNGASKEGTFNGVVNRRQTGRKTSEEAIAYNLEHIQEIGTPESWVNYPLAWAQAANTPFRNWKQDAHSEGGTRNPLIVYYPKGIKEKGGIRNQYGHVIDILPTTTELTGVNQPEYIRGIRQDSVHGISLLYSLDDAKAISRHTLQHYYIFGARSIYRDGWKAATAHKPDAIDRTVNQITTADPNRFANDVWELYDMNNDFNELHDLAAKYPEKLKELKTVFDRQAEKYHLYPLVDWYDLRTSVQRRKEAAKKD
jgi:arylsulfatase